MKSLAGETKRAMEAFSHARNVCESLADLLKEAVESELVGKGRRASVSIRVDPNTRVRFRNGSVLDIKIGVSYLEDLTREEMKIADREVESVFERAGFGRTSIEEARGVTRWVYSAFESGGE